MQVEDVENRYLPQLAALADDEVSALRRGFNRIKDSLRDYPAGVDIGGEPVVRHYVNSADICRYLEEHHRLDAPPESFVGSTLGLLAQVGAVKPHGSKYGLREYTAEDEELLQAAFRLRR